MDISKIAFDLSEHLPKNFINFSLTAVEADLSILPKYPAVYVFYNKDGRPSYTGKAKDLRVRIGQHLSQCHNEGLTDDLDNHRLDQLKVFFCASELNAKLLERFLIESGTISGYNNKQFTKNMPLLVEEEEDEVEEDEEDEPEEENKEKLDEELKRFTNSFRYNEAPKPLVEVIGEDTSYYKETFNRYQKIDDIRPSHRTEQENMKEMLFTQTRRSNEYKNPKKYADYEFCYVILHIMKQQNTTTIKWEDSFFDLIVGDWLKTHFRWRMSKARKPVYDMVPGFNFTKTSYGFKVDYHFKDKVWDKIIDLEPDQPRKNFWKHFTPDELIMLKPTAE